MTRKEEQDRRASKITIINMMRATASHNGNPVTDFEALANRLHRLETTLGRLAEIGCCRDMSAFEEAKQERLENLAERLVRENLGCDCYTQRDPRGYAIRMYLTDEEGNKWFNMWDGETTGLAW